MQRQTKQRIEAYTNKEAAKVDQARLGRPSKLSSIATDSFSRLLSKHGKKL